MCIMHAVQGLLAVLLYKTRPCIKLAVLTACISKSLCVMLAMRGSLVVKQCLLLIMTDICCFASQERKSTGREFHTHILLSFFE